MTAALLLAFVVLAGAACSLKADAEITLPRMSVISCEHNSVGSGDLGDGIFRLPYHPDDNQCRFWWQTEGAERRGRPAPPADGWAECADRENEIAGWVMLSPNRRVVEYSRWHCPDIPPPWEPEPQKERQRHGGGLDN